MVEKPHYFSIAFAIPLSRFVDGDRETKLTPVQATVFIFQLFICCLQVRDPVPLCLYANGILMFGGPFRPYSDPVTQVSSYLKIATFRFDYGYEIECEYEYGISSQLYLP